jgi:hypothetical protein
MARFLHDPEVTEVNTSMNVFVESTKPCTSYRQKPWILLRPSIQAEDPAATEIEQVFNNKCLNIRGDNLDSVSGVALAKVLVAASVTRRMPFVLPWLRVRRCNR